MLSIIISISNNGMQNSISEHTGDVCHTSDFSETLKCDVHLTGVFGMKMLPYTGNGITSKQGSQVSVGLSSVIIFILLRLTKWRDA